MKKSIYQSYDDLLLFLNAELIAKVLGVAPSDTRATASPSSVTSMARLKKKLLKNCISALRTTVAWS